MRNFFLILSLFCYFELDAQDSYRFIYEYSFKKDSLKKNELNKEIYFLDVNKQGSLFYSKDRAISDSILAASNEISVAFSDKIEKKYPHYDINQYTSLSGDKYVVVDDRIQKWKIISEKDYKILNYNVQKAELNFAGRLWTASFAKDIPIQDGPHKFHGLPGLIVRIEDSTQSHIFELIGVQKKSYNNFNLNDNFIPIEYSKYKKLYKEYRNNPTKKLMGVEISDTQDGISSNEFKKKMMEYHKRKLSSNNNILEIDLLK